MPEPDPNPVALSLPWGGDLQLTNNGSIAWCSGIEKVRQRIIRRFFTGPEQNQRGVGYIGPDYLFHPDYGQGAIRMVGQPMSDAVAAQLQTKARNAVLVDQGVDTSKAPKVDLYATPSGEVWIKIEVHLIDGTREYLNFATGVKFYS